MFLQKVRGGWGENFFLFFKLCQNALLENNCLNSYLCPCIFRDAFWPLISSTASTGGMLCAKQSCSQPGTGPNRTRYWSQNEQVVQIFLVRVWKAFLGKARRHIWQASENLFTDWRFSPGSWEWVSVHKALRPMEASSWIVYAGDEFGAWTSWPVLPFYPYAIQNIRKLHL